MNTSLRTMIVQVAAELRKDAREYEDESLDAKSANELAELFEMAIPAAKDRYSADPITKQVLNAGEKLYELLEAHR